MHYQFGASDSRLSDPQGRSVELWPMSHIRGQRGVLLTPISADEHPQHLQSLHNFDAFFQAAGRSTWTLHLSLNIITMHRLRYVVGGCRAGSCQTSP